MLDTLKNLFSKKKESEFYSEFPNGGFLNNVNTTNKSALTLSAFYNGIEILCNDYAKLPKTVFKKEKGDRIKQDAHPITYLIAKRPNELMTAFMFDKMMLQYAILKGNAYALIGRNKYGKPVALHLIEQDKTPVQVKKYKNKLWYIIEDEIYDSNDVLHVPGFSFNGYYGIGVVSFAAQSLGVNLSSQEYASDYYSSKGESVIVLTSPKDMDPDAKKKLSRAVTAKLSGKGLIKTMILDESTSFNQLKLTPQESQFLQTHTNGVLEVARWLNLPPHKLKSMEHATFSNIEHQEIAHVSDSILPWALKFKNEYEVKIFSKKEVTEGYFIKFNTESLIRADMVTMGDYLTKLVSMGILTRNDARVLLDFNKIEGLESPLTPVNTQMIEQINLKIQEIKQSLENVK